MDRNIESESLRDYFKKTDLSTNVGEFVDLYNIDDSCSITKWWKERADKTIGEVIDQFLVLADRDAKFARTVMFHVGFLLSDEIRYKFLGLIGDDPLESVLMWLEDSTISEEEANLLYDSFTNPTTGLPEYVKAINAGELVPVERGKDINEGSDIARSFLNGRNE